MKRAGWAMWRLGLHALARDGRAWAALALPCFALGGVFFTVAGGER